MHVHPTLTISFNYSNLIILFYKCNRYLLVYNTQDSSRSIFIFHSPLFSKIIKFQNSNKCNLLLVFLKYSKINGNYFNFYNFFKIMIKSTQELK
jgi:hypothetical protein